jgi:hypothetical protein
MGFTLREMQVVMWVAYLSCVTNVLRAININHVCSCKGSHFFLSNFFVIQCPHPTTVVYHWFNEYFVKVSKVVPVL